ncbi:SDR family oxidoreductase [Pseudomonas aeruginosa]|nr:SDR family oxidoreductase [Pseudomonas aeruginosa]
MHATSSDDFSLSSRVALVTGAGRGIGRGIALALARAGAAVAVADLDPQVAEETAAAIRSLGRRSLALGVDVSDGDSVRAMVERVATEFGRLDVAVNNAGVISIRKVAELSLADWDRVMHVNARGVFLCCQAELPLMQAQRWGRIVNLSSIAGKVGLPDLAHYCASKFAVIGFSNALAKEVARDGVTVNALCPGIVGTGMWRGEDGLSGRWRQAGESEAQSWERHQASLLPQGQAQTVEDMGQLVVYLACAPHVTGQAIAVAGGFSL